MAHHSIVILLQRSAFMALLLPSQVLASPQCADAVGCERKFCEMERQIDEAEKQGNRRQAAGLETALAEARKSCTDTSLYQDMARGYRCIRIGSR